MHISNEFSVCITNLETVNHWISFSSNNFLNILYALHNYKLFNE